MIYSQEECGVISDVLRRKELERSIYSSMDGMSPSLRSAIDCQLDLDIQRCGAMLRISANDFSKLDDDLQILSPHPV